MTRYFFHLRRHDGEVLPDESGTECPNLDFAIKEARSGVREMLAEAVRDNRMIGAEALLVADEEGHTLETIPLAGGLRDPSKDRLH